MILKLVFVFERSMEKYGGASQWETSVPIPNTAIKPLNADDSVKAKIGSRRTKEALNQGDTKVQGFFYLFNDFFTGCPTCAKIFPVFRFYMGC